MLRDTTTVGNTVALLLLLLAMALTGCSEVIIDPVALAESENATNTGGENQSNASDESSADDDDGATSDIGTGTSTDTNSDTDTDTESGNTADSDGVTTDNTNDQPTPDADNGGTTPDTNGETTTNTEVDTASDTSMDDDTGTETSDEPVIGNDTGTDSNNDMSASPIIVGLANCPALSASTSAANIAGIYDLTALSESGDDVVYLEIAENGTLIYYDYQQDEFDEGDNCYVIDRGLTAYSSVGGDEYIATGYSNYADVNCDISEETITVVRSDTQLSTTSVDIDDEDGDGDTTDLVTEVVPRVTGLTADSFNRCE